VILSSIGHEHTVPGGIDFDTLNDETKSTIVSRYGRSKLANILFGKALARRLAKERVHVNIAHPGYVDTELARHTSDTFGARVDTIFQWLTSIMAMSPKVGALTQLYLATSPQIENNNIRGRYFIPIANEIQPSMVLLLTEKRSSDRLRDYCQSYSSAFSLSL
jgi:retinol dehydrogenase-14